MVHNLIQSLRNQDERLAQWIDKINLQASQGDIRRDSGDDGPIILDLPKEFDINKFKEGNTLEDLCFSVQETALAMITEVTERALAHTEKSEVLLTGGVASNKRLQEMIYAMVSDRNDQSYVVPRDVATDNGAMIAWTGLLAYQNGITIPINESFVKQNWRIDEIEVPWHR